MVVAGLLGSVIALAFAPALMPADYSWISHTTSESAAQGVPGGWLARIGFVLMGLSVVLLSGLRHRRWGRWGVALHTAFGFLLLAAAVFSHRPWSSGYAVDRTEDLLHSVAATGMGFAFALGVVAVAMRRQRQINRRWLDALVVAASVAIPLAMSAMPAVDGLTQRLMFGLAFAWYVVEALSRR